MLSYLPHCVERLEPLVFRGREVFGLSRSAARAEGMLICQAGAAFRLRRLLDIRTLNEHCRRVNGPGYAQIVLAQAERTNARGCRDPLLYFHYYMVPALQRRDLIGAAPAAADVVGTTDWSEELNQALTRLPVPTYPTLAVSMFGRMWIMSPRRLTPGRVGIQIGSDIYGLTGQYVTIFELQRTWQQVAEAEAELVAKQLAGRLGPGRHDGSSELPKLRRELDEQGHAQRGDLLFIAANPPRVGHIIGVHYNRTLSRRCDRNLAITAPIGLPMATRPEFSADCIYQRVEDRWRRLSLPHGLCLGEAYSGHATFRTPALRWLAELRWAAERIRSNGRFHSAD